MSRVRSGPLTLPSVPEMPQRHWSPRAQQRQIYFCRQSHPGVSALTNGHRRVLGVGTRAVAIPPQRKRPKRQRRLGGDWSDAELQ
jgi:hypothetical protein